MMDNADRTQPERDGAAQGDAASGPEATQVDVGGPDGTMRQRGVPGARCGGTNRFGLPCRARAVKNGMCAVHAGLSDPVAMGKKGGSRTPETDLRKAVKHDDELREKARRALE